MLAKIEIIRQVLASASRAKLPRAEEAMDCLAEINAGMIELKEIHVDLVQNELDAIEAEDVANGTIAHG